MAKPASPDITELVERYSSRIYGVALRLTQNQADAEDVLQETFMTVMRKLDTFEERSSVYTWLYRIATNIALGKLRQQQKSPDVDIVPEDFERLASWSSDQGLFLGHDREDTAFIRQSLDRAISKLPENHRVVFLLRDVDGLSTRESADLLGLTPANVKVRLMRARIQLRNSLAHLKQPERARS